MSDTFYVTTPIYYVNGAPHIGHAYTSLAADALTRYHQAKGRRTFFLTGTDEHGLKVLRAAEKAGVTPQQMADENVARFKSMGERLQLRNDDFLRTTDERHKRIAQAIWRRVRAAGDIYLGKYEGWYAAADEQYYKEDEIADGHAITSGAAVEWVVEKSYFFKLSAYQDRLLQYYRDHPGFIGPESRRNEVIRFVEGGLLDLSVSRTTFDWGVPVPDDDDHVMYVWFDALTNYISALGVLADEGGVDVPVEQQNRTDFWPCDVHLVGKDIVRFHGVYWPAFLMSAGLQLPKKIFAHGWWLVDDEKMSKSKGNIVDPFALTDAYDNDVLRYFLFREIPFGNDGNFSEERIRERNNAELANTLGNLANRALTMSVRFLDGVVPDVSNIPAEDADNVVSSLAAQLLEDYDEQMNALQLHRVCETVMKLAHELNGYIQTQQPWALRKQGQADRVARVLYTALEGLRVIAVMANPLMPNTARKLLGSLGYVGPTIDENLNFSAVAEWGGLPAGNALVPGDVLFPRIDELRPSGESDDAKGSASPEEKGTKKGGKAAAKPARPAESDDGKPWDGTISFDQFMRTELRVGQVLLCEKVPKSDRLFRLEVDLGEAAPRQLVAGLAADYEAEQLIGKEVVVVANLKPAKIRGVKSNGMVLAYPNADGGLTVAEAPLAAELGARLK